MPLWKCTHCAHGNVPWAAQCSVCGQGAKPEEVVMHHAAISTGLDAPLFIDLKPVWKVPGTLHVYGVKEEPVMRPLTVAEKFYYKSLPFFSSEAKLKKIEWDGATPVSIQVGVERKTYSEEREEKGHGGNVLSASVSREGDVLLSTDSQFRVVNWNAQTGEKLSSRLPKVEGGMFIGSSQGVMIGGYETAIRIWHPNGDVQYSIPNPSRSPIRFLELTPRRDLLVAVAANGSVMVWEYTGADTLPFRPIYTTRIKTQRVLQLATASDPFRFAVGLDNGEIIVWGAESLTAPTHRRLTTTPIHALEFSAYGPQMMMSDDSGGIMVFRDERDKQPTAFKLKDSRKGILKVGCLRVVSPVGHLIAGDSQGQLQVWDWTRRNLIKVIQTGIPGLHTLAVNPVYKTLVVAGQSGNLACYNLDEIVG
jgi:WD40 repeat protein